MATLSDLISGIKLRQAEISESLVNGNAINFETYQRLVGTHQGLSEALLILDNLLEEEEKDVV